MWAFLTGGLSSLISGFVGPLFTYLNKKQDVTLDGFKTGTGFDLDAYRAATQYDLEVNRLKLQANSWWGPRVLYMLVGGTAALHSAAIFLDSTLTFGTGHYGNLGIPPLPKPYDTYEQWVVASLFVVATVERPLSAVTAWMHR